jgi:predicted ArsR family transcriptional regulator
MKTSRQLVLEYLKAHQPLSAAQLAVALQMTAANARHHLHVLAQEGLVEPAAAHLAGGRGRPAKTYQVVQPRRGPLYLGLLAALLEATRPAAADIPAAAGQLAARWLAVVSPDLSRGGPWAQRLTVVTRWLGEQGLPTRWQATPAGPELILSGSPFASLIEDDPWAAALEAAWLGALTGAAAVFNAPASARAGGERIYWLQRR